MDKNISLILLAVIMLSLSFIGSCSHQSMVNSQSLVEYKNKEVIQSVDKESAPLQHKASGGYLLRDSSLIARPLWLDEPQRWARENEANWIEYEYLTFETEPKFNRNLACEFSRSNIRVELAATIAETLRENILSHIEQKDISQEKKMKLIKFFTEKLADKVQSFIKGASVLNSYWEYREYRKDQGAADEFKAYACASLIRIHKSNIVKTIELSKDFLLNGKLIEKADLAYHNLVEKNSAILLKRYSIAENQLP